MVNRTLLVIAAAVLLAGVLMVATQWRGEPHGVRAETDAATRGFAGTSTGARSASSELQDSRSPAVEPATPELPVEPSRDAASQEQGLKALIEGVDPLLRERNVIVRAPAPGETGPGFGELESRFGTETVDPGWSSGMEARILGEVAQLTGLKLVSLEAECRATICRLKLFHPPGTNALSSLDDVAPLAKRIGLGHVVNVATLGEDGVPISLLYFERE